VVGAGTHQAFLGGTGTQACAMADVPAAMMPNSNVLLALSAGKFVIPTNFFEYSPTGNSYTPAPGASDAAVRPPFSTIS
jgi:hypothetical protein